MTCLKVRHVTDVDVVVVGAGSAGSAAAIAAGRAGKRVVLLDRYGFAGGTGAAVLDTFYGFFTPGEHPAKVVGGIPDEVVAFLVAREAAIHRPNTYGAGTGITYNPEMLKVAWDSLLEQAGVEVLFHSVAVDVLMRDGTVLGVVFVNRAGLQAIRARVVIDASGDADVAARAGAPFVRPGADGYVQSLTTTFRLANVDDERARRVSRTELHEKMRAANRSGCYRLLREEGSIHATPYPGVMAANMVRIRIDDPTDPAALSVAEREGRRQALEYVRFLRGEVSGYEDAVLMSFGTQIGVRESRRIEGEYQLTRDDVLLARHFDDAIALCGAPIEDHHDGADTRWEYIPSGRVYGIPYRCLLPRVIDGLLVAGRCLSATHDAHASVRSMGQCMAMGQAAGTAAALAVRDMCVPRAVDVAELRSTLTNAGAIV